MVGKIAGKNVNFTVELYSDNPEAVLTRAERESFIVHVFLIWINSTVIALDIFHMNKID